MGRARRFGDTLILIGVTLLTLGMVLVALGVTVPRVFYPAVYCIAAGVGAIALGGALRVVTSNAT